MRHYRLRNIFILVTSYVFYGWWDWRFLLLIAFSSGVDFWVGIMLSRTEQDRIRKACLFTSLGCNLGLLFAFKYFDFFVQSLVGSLALIGVDISNSTPLLDWVLPVGISFYTFQTLSYTIDVYRKKLEPTRDVIAFFAYVSFFPQLVAGPIERASRLLPQFLRREVKFDPHYAYDGLRMILWGLFLKAVLADSLAIHVDAIFGVKEEMQASLRLLGLVYFSFQIMGDFAGYSLIARGVARLLGFDLMVNFRTPYFSRDIAEFWRRWHISLSSWFKDYVYIPLGGSHGGRMKAFRNVMIVFLVSGLWHGANMTFVIWGLIHALLYIPLMLGGRNRIHCNAIAPGACLPKADEFMRILMTFVFVTIAWVFFRAESVGHALSYLGGMCDWTLFSMPHTHRSGLVLIVLTLLVEWCDRNRDTPLKWDILPRSARWGLYSLLASLLYYRGYFGEQQFIYFQF